jgi:hypothetical protein
LSRTYPIPVKTQSSQRILSCIQRWNWTIWHVSAMLCVGPICLNVIWNPITCGSVGCYSSFCESCIGSWLKRVSQEEAQSELDDDQPVVIKGCPKCKRPFKHISIPLLKSLLECLILKCLYHKNGCKEQISYRDLQQHAKECSFKRLRCEGCS